MIRTTARPVFILIFCAILWSSANAAAQPDAAAAKNLQERADLIDTYLSRLAAMDVFDGVVLVAEGERVLLAKGYGEADREADRPWTTDTVSTIGSVTKQFTGAAITLLAQEGRLSFDDTVGDYFPDAPPDKGRITIHQLLTHASGLPGAIGNDEEPIDRSAYFERAWERPLLFEPGARYEYSNVGYSVLGAIIETVTETPYESFVRERLFLPAGMHHTGYVIPQWNEDELAIGYRGERRWGTVIEKQKPQFSWHLVGNGGMHSTVGDMRRWWLAIRNHTILNEEMTERYLAPHQDEGSGDSFYGYGWVNWTLPGGERMINHNGGNDFLGAECAFFPESDLFAVLLINDLSQSSFVAGPLLGLLTGQPVIMPPDPSSIDVSAVNAAARARALAFVEAINNGPDALVRFGAEHRADQGQDESLNESRRQFGRIIAEEHGGVRIVRSWSKAPGVHEIEARGEESGARLRMTVRVSYVAPYFVETIGIESE